ncbi:hypothetical protein Ple7327_3960 [Pleurocapsa sp. PCC 7327]|uniref:glycoside hydrolase family 10 protein n=1 Tax=Pleurocapsa sp. PCC 7327 TaxID=118163 RepID=UPI00029F950E|nr:glycoside hydrolase family 10 protein [Pleurocapsa sp. PCC 7327]AFY79106.1 hypothetical protein Ple7327_3960 [Pleurocapsa sp. PCC 7327]
MKQYLYKILTVCADGLVELNRRFGRQAWLIFLLIFGFTLAWLALPARSQNPYNEPAEIRGVWLTNIDSDVLFERQRLADAIDTLSQLNFNTLYPTIWNWGHTLYPSAVAEAVIGLSLDPAQGLQGRDILAETIERGRDKGMAVIPWFEFGFMAPADSQLAKRHPEWLTKRLDGSTVWLEGNIHKRVWLNPFRPDVQQFITDLVVEIVSKYDVDGIQVDDHFGFPYDFGYDDYTIKLYQQEHNGKLPPKPPANIKTVNNCVANNREWTEWTRWRANKVTDYMKQLFAAIKDSNPDAIVSVSPNPQAFSLNCYLADWQKWERMGLVEEIVLQVYRDDMKAFLRELSQAEVRTAKEHIPFGIGVLSGLKGRLVPIEQIKTQVATVRKQGFAGVSFFFYESLWNLAQEPLEQRQSAFQDLFATPMKRARVL